MKPNYEALRKIFVQNSLSRVFLDQKIKALNPSFMNIGELEFWCWRYTFAKDITRKFMTNKLLEFKFDNLTTVEILNALHSTRAIVRKILTDARKEVKKNPRQVRAFLKGKTK